MAFGPYGVDDAAMMSPFGPLRQSGNDVDMEVMDQDSLPVASMVGSPYSAPMGYLACAARTGNVQLLHDSMATWLSQFGAKNSFTRHSADEMLEAIRDACAADSPACVSLLLKVTTTILRSPDCALEALIAAAGTGRVNALEAVLSSLELRKHMQWRGPKAAPMLAEAMSNAMRCAIACGADTCLNTLLRSVIDPETPAAAARAELAPHMHAVFCEAARCSARGALQSLLVCLPEHCDALDFTVLEAAQEAGQVAAAADIKMLLAMRAQAVGQEEAQMPMEPVPLCALPDACVFIDSTSAGGFCCASPTSTLCGMGSPAAPPAPGSSCSSMPSSTSAIIECCSSATSSSAGSDIGAIGDMDATDSGQATHVSRHKHHHGKAGGASWAQHPYMTRPNSGGSPKSLTAPMPETPCPPVPHRTASGNGTLRPPLVPDSACAAASAPASRECRLRAALRQAVALDNVTRAAQLLTELVDASERLEAAPCVTQQPMQALDAFIIDLITEAAAAGACDCAHLLMTAVGSNEDQQLKMLAARALCLPAAATGRCALLRVCTAHHPWLATAMAAGGAALMLECLRAAMLRAHPHTAVWVARQLPAPGLVQAAMEALVSTPAWQLQQEAAALGFGSKGPAARPDATCLVGVFKRAWASAERLRAGA